MNQYEAEKEFLGDSRPQAGQPMATAATLRDFFAASALAGLVQVCRRDAEIVEQAYSIADQMIQARKQ